ncbi:hypothetical protein GCM10007937_42390 [Mesorhizobium albiziae]|nr:hypothetical protein GCM10007937_42390 [Mesorhizobium albiziae]
MDVEHDTFRATVRIATEKRLGRRKFLYSKAVRVQQASDAPAHAGIVFHDGNSLWPAFHLVAFLKLYDGQTYIGLKARPN